MQPDRLSLLDVSRMLRRNARLLFGTAGVVIALTAVWTYFATRIYESEALLQITVEDPQAGALAQLGPVAGMGLPGLAQDELETEVGLIRSRYVADAVASSVGLHVQLLSPDRPRSSILKVIRADPNADRGTFLLSYEKDGRYRVSVEKARTRVATPESVRIGERFEIGKVSMALPDSLRRDPPKEIRFRIESFPLVVAEMREDLQVERQGAGSTLVEVAYRHSDPRIAAAVVNGAVRTYMDYKAGTEQTDAHGTIGVLREQVRHYEQRLLAAEERLKVFREQQQVILPEEQATQQVRLLAEVQAKRDALQVEREALSTLLREVSRRASRDASASPYRQLATFPSFISNEAVQNVLETLTTLENERSELLVRRTEANTDVRRIQERIGELEGQLHRMASGYLENLGNEISSTQAVMDRFAATLGTAPAREVEFARLSRDQLLLSEIFIKLQTRLREAEVQDAIRKHEVRVVDLGLLPEEPVSPRPLVNLVLGTILGLLLGLSAVIGRDMLDTKIRSRADAETAAAGVPVLGMIPPTRPATHSAATRRMVSAIRIPRIAGRVPEIDTEERLVVRRDPWGPEAEAYRGLAANLALGGTIGTSAVLVITSALQGEGKTTVAANLAATFALRGTRTLLIDADVRRGALHRIFGVDLRPGLTDVLGGATALKESIRHIDLGVSGAFLHLLPAGQRPGQPADLLQTERMRRLLQELGGEYDLILFDVPPVSVAADATLIASVADATLLVARNDSTERAALEHAAERLARVNGGVRGVVLNDYSAAASRREYDYQPVLGNGRSP